MWICYFRFFGAMIRWYVHIIIAYQLVRGPFIRCHVMWYSPILRPKLLQNSGPINAFNKLYMGLDWARWVSPCSESYDNGVFQKQVPTILCQLFCKSQSINGVYCALIGLDLGPPSHVQSRNEPCSKFKGSSVLHTKPHFFHN